MLLLGFAAFPISLWVALRSFLLGGVAPASSFGWCFGGAAFLPPCLGRFLLGWRCHLLPFWVVMPPFLLLLWEWCCYPFLKNWNHKSKCENSLCLNLNLFLVIEIFNFEM